MPKRMRTRFPPFAVGFDGFAAAELERLRGRLIAEGLALQVNRDGENFECVSFGFVHEFFGERRGTGIVIRLPQIEFPTGDFVTVEARLLNEFDPLGMGDIPELAANEADLVETAFTVLVRRGLLVAHGKSPGKFKVNFLPQRH